MAQEGPLLTIPCLHTLPFSRFFPSPSPPPAPSPQARGLTWFIPGEDATLISKQQIFARIVGALGGRAAEEVVFGEAEVTTGASSDLQMVRRAEGADTREAKEQKL